MRKFAVALCLIVVLAGAAWAAYPEKNIQGYVMWGAGGALDNVSRAIAPIAQEHLGKTIILQNRTGATGAIATTFVANQPADGYSILFGAENPNLYKVTDLSKIDYDDFEPAFLMMANVGVVVVAKDSPYKSYKDLIEAAASGKSITMGSTGPGGLPYVAATMIEKIHGVKFNKMQFDGEGPCITALMGGHIDAVPVGLLAAASFIQSGSISGLAMISSDRVDSVPEVPAVTEVYEEYAPYLPWGAFFGAFVKKGTPADVISVLTGAFEKAFKDPRFEEFAKTMGGVKLGIAGEEAKKYIAQNKSVAAWLLYDAGGAKFSPEEFGIPRPEGK
ncbi:MAG: Bug family tripartite tricarboxylate transporter substrate binding protein [Aminivibrio sp.]|jgi:tripartite-type tricarboxylate transporter receptor subunit TctC|nr:tripartite tricarboxylate transporter substrate binding protein [Synergistaceae bacterium]